MAKADTVPGFPVVPPFAYTELPEGSNVANPPPAAIEETKVRFPLSAAML